ncbi:MAG: ABC transporter ATP-binding protein [Gammaproteobacteria bacterium]|nr:ABC transporter ATP-binding protein [Gammaproteobacteria bacterium]
MSTPILQVKNLGMRFGGIKALDDLDLDVNSGEIVALIGPNGAGKTTFFNCVTGIYNPTQGDVVLTPPGTPAIRLNGLKPNQVAEKGMARTFQNIRLFQKMTVLENVMIGRHCRTNSFILGAILRNTATRQEEQETIHKSYKILQKMGLEKHANDLASNLSYGAQRRLEIGRALATEPFLLLLDEPAAGMNPQETQELIKLINLLQREGQSILLIEHDMKLVMELSHRIFVMDYGRRIAMGTPEEIRNNPVVIKAYLGESADA